MAAPEASNGCIERSSVMSTQFAVVSSRPCRDSFRRLWRLVACAGWVVSLLPLLGPPRSARAAAYDGFDYPVGPTTNLSGGTGLLAPWQNGSTSSSVVAGSLSDPTGTLL